MLMCIVFCLFPTVKSININTPTISNSIEPFDNKTVFTINITSDNTFLYNNNEVSLSELENFISQQLKISGEKQDLDDIKIFIRADKYISYETIMSVIQQLNNAGFTDISLVGK
jgi:biopolymer transport protein ExbD